MYREVYQTYHRKNREGVYDVVFYTFLQIIFENLFRFEIEIAKSCTDDDDYGNPDLGYY